MPTINKKAIAVGAAGLVLATGAGAAFAYWTSTGSGDGKATTGTSSVFEVDVDSVDLDLHVAAPVEEVVNGLVTVPARNEHCRRAELVQPLGEHPPRRSR